MEIPSNLTFIGREAFSYCNSLTTLSIDSSISGEGAFSHCTNLTNVIIGDNVISISDYAFYAFCSSLTDVYYTGTEEDWAKISIGSNNSYLTDATIHYNYVPEE